MKRIKITAIRQADYKDLSLEENGSMTYLSAKWKEIKELIADLDREPYIDDQYEIAEIWKICEEMIRSRKLQDESWENRKRVLKDIIESGDYYDYYGVIDPMQELFQALMQNDSERIECADMIFNIGTEFMQEDAAVIYKQCGEMGKYLDYLWDHLRDEKAPYLELIDYYQDRDLPMAIKAAELGMQKCKEEQTDILLFLLKLAVRNHDEDGIKRLLKSSKLRRRVNYNRVMEEYARMRS